MRARTTWDAAARTASDVVIGRPEFARTQLEALFSDLGAAPEGDGVCLEIGCGAGRMTTEIAPRWREVVAVDVSPAMLDRAKAAVAAAGIVNVVFALVGADALDGVATASVDTVVCYGVLQHLPTRRAIGAMLREIARALRAGGEAFVQVPVLDSGARARAWRAARAVALRLRLRPAEYHGARVTASELDRAVAGAGLDVVARSERDGDPTLYSRYPHAREVRLRLRAR
jgi:SAM-dependent methyltransferase